MKIGTYFDDYEFACKCGRHGYDSDGHPILDHIIDKRLVDVLDAIRERIGKPIEVLSGYRCPEHNVEVGGVPNSQHVEAQRPTLLMTALTLTTSPKWPRNVAPTVLENTITKTSYMLMCEGTRHVGMILIK